MLVSWLASRLDARCDLRFFCGGGAVMQPSLRPNKGKETAQGESPVNVEHAVAERRRSLRRSGRLHAGTKAMLVGVVGAALAAVFFVVGESVVLECEDGGTSIWHASCLGTLHKSRFANLIVDSPQILPMSVTGSWAAVGGR